MLTCPSEPILAVLLRRRYMNRIRMVASLPTQQHGYALRLFVMGALGVRAVGLCSRGRRAQEACPCPSASESQCCPNCLLAPTAGATLPHVLTDRIDRIDKRD